jgi:diguanylate cyclase (GGDEF)-like protein
MAFVLFIDINGLKNVNDTHGHAVGDRVIAHVARAAREVVSEGDLLGRWGGDEFVIVGSGALPDPSVVQRRVVEVFDLADLRAVWPEGVSVGGASGDLTFPELLAAADADMYERRQRARGSRGTAV